MPNPMPPALTASEWGRIHPLPRVVGGAPRVAIACGLREPGVPGEKALSFDPATEPHALMAALNATLADDDPRMITREDVAAVEQSLWAQYGDGFTVDCLSYCATCQRELPAGSMTFCRQHHADKLRDLAAKLEALLPETQGRPDTRDSTNGTDAPGGR